MNASLRMSPVRIVAVVGLAMSAAALAAPPAEALIGPHPRIESSTIATPMLPNAGSTSPTIPVLSPGTHAEGTYVNYESPPVKPLALTEDGARLLAVNTPDNSLTVIDPYGAAGGTRMKQLRRVGVGLEPVAVAIQPTADDTANRFAWTANFISDDLSVVEIETGKVVATIAIGDEPVNIMFTPDGRHAMVITQGPSVLSNPSSTAYRGGLTIVDAQTLVPISFVELDCNNPRAAVYDARNRRVIVAALHSGNDTTVVGRRNRMFFAPGSEPPSVWTLTLNTAQSFSITAPIFAASPELSPWPDVGAVPNSPLTHRIIDSTNGAWQQIKDAITLDDGTLDPVAVAQFAAETGATNAAVLLQAVIDDGAERVDHDLIAVSVANPVAPAVSFILPGIGTTLPAMALHPTRARVLVANLEPKNLTRLTPNLRGNFMSHQLVSVDLPNPPAFPVVPVPARIDLHADIPNFNDASHPNPAAQAGSLANPVDVLYAPDGTRAFVAALGTDRVGIVNPTTGAVLSRVDVGRGPRGLVLDPSGRRLYTYNRTDMSISVVDVSSALPAVQQTFPLFTPESRDVSEGRHFLFSTKIANNASSSCAMCHIDARLDHLAWDLGDPHAANLLPVPTNLGPPLNHPIKGPMVTQSLQGLRNHNAFHWRGDKPEFIDFNEAFNGLLGGSEITDEEMGKYDTFAKSITYPPNPFYDRENRFKSPAALAVGAVHFANNCNGCHSIGHDGTFRAPGSIDDFAFNFNGPPLFLQAQEIAQLRGIYKKFPSDHFGGFGLLHDGSEESENNGHPLSTFLFEFFPGIPAADHQAVIDFVGSFQGNSMGAVGWQLTFTDAMDVAAISELLPMLSMATQTPIAHCDVAARATIGGTERGFVFSKPSPGQAGTMFMDDTGTLIDLPSLAALIRPGDAITFIATPPGSGERIGINWDGDCMLNGLDAFPLSSPNHNRDANLDPDDLGDFLNDFFAVPPAIHADFNRDGEINPDDLGDYLNEYFFCTGG